MFSKNVLRMFYWVAFAQMPLKRIQIVSFIYCMLVFLTKTGTNHLYRYKSSSFFLLHKKENPLIPVNYGCLNQRRSPDT